MLPDLTELPVSWRGGMYAGKLTVLLACLDSNPAIVLQAACLSPTQFPISKMEAVTVPTSKGMVGIEWINLYKPP